MRLKATLSVVCGLLFCLHAQMLSAEMRYLKPAPELPTYQLSNIRKESGSFGRSVIVFDWKLTKPGTGAVYFEGRNKAGTLSITFNVPLHGTGGTARFEERNMFGSSHATDSATDVEFWVVHSVDGKIRFMLSNPVRLGNPGPPIITHAMTDQDQAAWEQAKEKARLAALPPAKLPPGFVAVTESTLLIPGMPVQAGWQGGWVQAEVISLNDSGSVNLLIPSLNNQVLDKQRTGWIAVDPAVLARAVADPQAFKPSRVALPNSKLEVPRGGQVIPADLELPQGTPIMIEGAFKWEDAFVIIDSGREIKVRKKDAHGGWDKSIPRNKCLILSVTLLDIKDPAHRELFLQNLQLRSLKPKSYPIKGVIPPDSQIVPEDLAIPSGTKLGGYWASGFSKLTLLYTNNDGTLRIHWDDYGDAWDCDMKRSELIISKSDVLRLTRLAQEQPAVAVPESRGGATTPTMPAAGGAQNAKLRSWTDVSGEFTIEAAFVKLENGLVLLKTADGEELEIELTELNAESRLAALSLSNKPANPFRKAN